MVRVPVRALIVQVLSRLWANFLNAVPRLVVTFTRMEFMDPIIDGLPYRVLLLSKTGISEMSLMFLVMIKWQLLVWIWVVVAVIVLTLEV